MLHSCLSDLSREPRRQFDLKELDADNKSHPKSDEMETVTGIKERKVVAGLDSAISVGMFVGAIYVRGRVRGHR